jgi:hypothetical protein
MHGSINPESEKREKRKQNIMNPSQDEGFPRTDSLLGPYLQEADAYLKIQIDQAAYQRITSSEDRRAHPHAAARIRQNNDQWNKDLWISHHGFLAGCGQRTTNHERTGRIVS